MYKFKEGDKVTITKPTDETLGYWNDPDMNYLEKGIHKITKIQLNNEIWIDEWIIDPKWCKLINPKKKPRHQVFNI